MRGGSWRACFRRVLHWQGIGLHQDDQWLGVLVDWCRPGASTGATSKGLSTPLALKPQPNGSVAVLLINTGSVTRNISLKFSDYVGFGGVENKPSTTEASTSAAVVYVRDIFSRHDLGQHRDSMTFEVTSHDSVFVLLTRGRVDTSIEAPK
jgi:hypothetical protein